MEVHVRLQWPTQRIAPDCAAETSLRLQIMETTGTIWKPEMKDGENGLSTAWSFGSSYGGTVWYNRNNLLFLVSFIITREVVMGLRTIDLSAPTSQILFGSCKGEGVIESSACRGGGSVCVCVHMQRTVCTSTLFVACIPVVVKNCTGAFFCGLPRLPFHRSRCGAHFRKANKASLIGTFGHANPSSHQQSVFVLSHCSTRDLLVSRVISVLNSKTREVSSR